MGSDVTAPGPSDRSVSERYETVLPLAERPGRPKVMTILGTRPEIIRLSRVIAKLDDHTPHVLVHTGQNRQYELNGVFFSDLDIRAPDYFLGVDTTSPGRMMGEILIKAEEVLVGERPDAVLILGDTHSSLAALVARKMCIPVYHMEAGNRCFDRNVPEELNRIVVDHVSDFNLVYTEHARRHLLSEGFPHRRIYLTGSPMREVLDHALPRALQSTVLDRLGLEPGGYFVVSVHRAENVDPPENLRRVIRVLRALWERYGVPIIVSTHPRTEQRLHALGAATVQCDGDIRFLAPFGYADYLMLQTRARCTISDSGTISEESAMLGFPAITLRTAMERPEALDAGTIIITGLDADVVVSAVDIVCDADRRRQPARIPWEYEIVDVSDRVVRLILGTYRLTHRWTGIDPPGGAGAGDHADEASQVLTD